MKFYTSVYRSKGADWGVILQQLMRQDGVPVLFACLCKEEMYVAEQGRSERNGAEERSGLTERNGAAERVGQSVRRIKGLMDRLTDWFYEVVLALCGRGKPEHCVDKVLKTFLAMAEQEDLNGISLAVWFAMGEECFYAWQGKAKLYVFQILFDRVKERPLYGRDSAMLQNTAFQDSVFQDGVLRYERVTWEVRTGIMLGNQELFDGMEQTREIGKMSEVKEMSEVGEMSKAREMGKGGDLGKAGERRRGRQNLAECLRATGLKTAKQVERHLRELGETVEEREGQEVTVIFCLPVEDVR